MVVSTTPLPKNNNNQKLGWRHMDFKLVLILPPPFWRSSSDGGTWSGWKPSPPRRCSGCPWRTCISRPQTSGARGGGGEVSAPRRGWGRWRNSRGEVPSGFVEERLSRSKRAIWICQNLRCGCVSVLVSLRTQPQTGTLQKDNLCRHVSPLKMLVVLVVSLRDGDPCLSRGLRQRHWREGHQRPAAGQ